ncbi:MAG: DeoR family transcriptional regulator [Lachnospiraceae bacterium]
MKRTDRLTEIKKMVAKQGRIELTELSQLFGVSVVTIRKDVEILQERNSVRRVHGAVVALEEPELQEEEKTALWEFHL